MQFGGGVMHVRELFPDLLAGRRLKTVVSEVQAPLVKIRSDGLSSITVVLGGTLWVSHTLPPITEPRPMTVSPPRIVAPA